jgi:hypothetical protein
MFKLLHSLLFRRTASPKGLVTAALARDPEPMPRMRWY